MGAGKSSLMHLIAGLYDKFQGQLLYNDISYQYFDLESLRGYIGDNFKEEGVFEASLLDNITLGKTGVDQQKLQQIITLTDLQDFIDELPNGIQTILPPSGISLAESIRTRIIMARSLVGDHRLLLLQDHWQSVEPTVVSRWFDHICKSNSPTLILSTTNEKLLKRMDRVLVMKNGEIIDSGKYDDIKNHLPC